MATSHRSNESPEDKKTARRELRLHQREVQLSEGDGVDSILIDLRISRIQFGISAGFPNVSFSIWVPCDDLFEADKEKTLTRAIYRLAQMACENYPKSSFCEKWYVLVKAFFKARDRD